MGLRVCKKCQLRFDTSAKQCPSCGTAVASTRIGAFIVFGILMLLTFTIVYSPTTKYPPAVVNAETSSPTASGAMPEQSPATVAEVAASAPPATPASAPWEYNKSEDPMTSRVRYFATLYSTNSVNFSFPYDGEQLATLILRTGNGDSSVLFRIQKGQFLCSSYDGCSVQVRFDDNKPIQFSAGGPADQSTEVLFIQNYSKFYALMVKSKRVRISANIYQEGAPVFEFDVSGFNPASYKPKPAKK